jgi:hypothetical protein
MRIAILQHILSRPCLYFVCAPPYPQFGLLVTLFNIVEVQRSLMPVQAAFCLDLALELVRTHSAGFSVAVVILD